MNFHTKQRFDVDPILEKIADYIPDKEIDYIFHNRKFNTQGRLREFKTSQLYRTHLLTMIKGVTSFNKICTELKTRRSFRDFCHFKNKNKIPTNRILSEFRGYLKPSGFKEITRLITSIFLNTIKLPVLKIVVPDSTDIPANCKGFAKKNAHVLGNASVVKNILLMGPLKEKGQKRVGKVLSLLGIRSIPCACG